MRTFLIFLLVDGLFSSDTKGPNMSGSTFVFSFQPEHFVVLTITPQQGGLARLKLLCARNCQDIYRERQVTAVYPNSVSWQLAKSKPVHSGTLLPVFRLTASKGVTVTMMEAMDLQSIDATVLVPEHLCGMEFYVITPFSHGVVIVTTFDNPVTHVDITMKFNGFNLSVNDSCLRASTNSWPMTARHHPPTYPFFIFDSSTPSSQQLVPYEPAHITLGALESYYILTQEGGSDISGLHIRSDKPIAATQGANTTKPVGSKNEDLALDSIPPVETLGCFFLVPYSTVNPEESIIKVVSAVGNNRMGIQVENTLSIFTFQYKSDWMQFCTSFRQIVFLSSSGPVMVIRTITNIENFSSVGPCMMSIVPTIQWGSYFLWTSVTRIEYQYSRKTLDDFAIISVLANYSRSILLDRSFIPEEDWISVDALIGSPSDRKTYKIVAVRLLTKASHDAFMVGEQEAGFFVTLFSYAAEISYCTSAGQAMKTFNSSLKQYLSRSTGDKEGNNEEADDGEDNSRNHPVIEDVVEKTVADGGWGEWTPFQCVVSCGETQGVSTRVRRCDSPPVSGAGAPCPGIARETRDAACKGDYVKCAGECAVNEWGYNCSRKCNNCNSDCDKVTGECKSCRPGFTSKFCNQTCPYRCRTCLLNGTCLSCSSGLTTPPACDAPCIKGFYGFDCKAMCPNTCWDSECEAKSGACLRCPAGKNGFNCTLVKSASFRLRYMMTKKSREKYWYFGLVPVILIPIITAIICRKMLRMRERRRTQIQEQRGGNDLCDEISDDIKVIEVVEIP